MGAGPAIPAAAPDGNGRLDMDVIRQADAGDLAAVEGIVREAYAVYTPRIGKVAGPVLADYAALIAAGLVRVLESDGAVVGVLVLVEEPDGMLLDNVAVAAAAQGRGFGRRLIAFAEAAARDAGHADLRLYTNEAMTENLALYTRLGFVETHRAEAAGYRRVYMRKPLDA